MKKIIAIIITVIFMISLGGCSEDTNPLAEKQEGFTVYSKEEQIEIFLENKELFDALYKSLLPLEERYLRFSQKKYGEKHELYYNGEEDISAEIVQMLNDFCAITNCRKITWGNCTVRIFFWDEFGISEITYLEKGPDPENANCYTKLAEHWYYGEFPYDMAG